jgi:hypothetical protein
MKSLPGWLVIQRLIVAPMARWRFENESVRYLKWGQNAKNSTWSAVGTVIADRPPPKSVQAEFPHTAPTLGA